MPPILLNKASRLAWLVLDTDCRLANVDIHLVNDSKKNKHTVDGSEIRRLPVDTVVLSHYLQGELYIPGGFLADF